MEWLFVYGLVFARLVSFMAMLPMIGDSQFMPPMAKGVFLVCLLPFMVAPEVAMSIHLQADVTYVLLFIKECAIGLLMGFLVGLPLRVPEMIGDLIDQQRGAAVTDKYNILSGQESSYIGQLLMITVMAYFMEEGGLDYLVRIIGGSFTLQAPHVFGFNFGDTLKDLYLIVFGDFMRLFAILAMPVVVAMLLSELALGLASRSAPAINAFQLSQPVKAIVAILVCIAIEPKIINATTAWFHTLGDRFGG